MYSQVPKNMSAVGAMLKVFSKGANLESAAPCLVHAGVVDEGPVGGPVQRRRLVRDEDLVKGESYNVKYCFEFIF